MCACIRHLAEHIILENKEGDPEETRVTFEQGIRRKEHQIAGQLVPVLRAWYMAYLLLDIVGK